jgi:hypothetical protein
MYMAKLESAFRSALALPQGYAVRELVYRGVPQWDSVAHMQLVSKIENAFDIMLDANDVVDLSSFAKAIEILRKHGVTIYA